MLFKVLGGQRLSETASEGPKGSQEAPVALQDLKNRCPKMEPNCLICLTDFEAI